jgi:predicted MPP superfamily phosphohydrolase
VEAEGGARGGLMLSTRGGQIWPFDYLTRIFYPLIGGRYEVDGMPVFVCRGTGTWGPRMRLWRPGEILRVTLRARATAKPAS